MQQTETYKLNLIDMDDNFSPQPLNENMDKLETILSALDGADAALGQRVTALEAHKLAIGSYTGTSATQKISLGFQPKAVIIQVPRVSGDCFLATALGGCATLTDTGFTLTTDGSPNYKNTQYTFVAIK